MNIKLRKSAMVVFITTISLALIGVSGAWFVLQWGRYDIAARRPHLEVTQHLLSTLKRNSVEYWSSGLVTPDLATPHRIKNGLILYRQLCVGCHGAPGVARKRYGVGLNPNPPPLWQTASTWQADQIAWITTHGLKMAGMPSFGLGLEEEEIWDITAFVVRLQTISPADYRLMVEHLQTGENEPEWQAPDGGWERLRQGNLREGRQFIRSYGCATCHEIGGLGLSGNQSAVPLTHWQKRQFISGLVINSPHNLVQWIQNPQAMHANSAMPKLGVSEEEAWSIAKYLYQQ